MFHKSRYYYSFVFYTFVFSICVPQALSQQCQIINCLSCQKNSRICNECDSRFYHQYGNCKACNINCLQCFDYGTCKSCHQGYIMVNNNCIDCSLDECNKNIVKEQSISLVAVPIIVTLGTCIILMIIYLCICQSCCCFKEPNQQQLQSVFTHKPQTQKEYKNSNMNPQQNIGSLQKMLCNVCKQNYIDSYTFCKHFFHAACIKQWVQVHGNCPTCRNSLTKKKFQLIDQIIKNQYSKEAWEQL